MSNYFEETIYRITEQEIEQEIRNDIQNIKKDANDELYVIKEDAVVEINKKEVYAIGEDSNGGEVNRIKNNSLAYIDQEKTKLAEFGNESKTKAIGIYEDIRSINADTDNIVENTVSKTIYNIKDMIANNGYVVKVFYDDIGDVSLVLEILDGIHYVSFGDSIAAGHTINENWIVDYGEDSQYGKNGNASTAIVPESYTHRMHNELISSYGEDNVTSTSFARSGDTVADLIEKLSHDVVIKTIKKADVVTVCIGANDVLQPALSHLEEYIYAGNLSEIESIVENNLLTLEDDSAATSYVSLFNRFKEINPDAKYAFTTVYNPYKYLWIEEGQNGFFSPILNTIPQINILGFDVSSSIKNGLLNTSIVQMLFNRINGLDDWAERYVTALNRVLKNKIVNAGDNFFIADTKEVFDVVPDRPYSANYHYNDLVSVEYTRGYDTAQMDWGALWRDNYGDNVAQYWINLATKYVSTSGIDLEGFATEFVMQLVEKVILPDIDPHPETYGHYVMKRSFDDAFGSNMLSRHSITFNSNGGSGSMSSQQVVGIDATPSFINLNANAFSPQEGYYFTGWNTKSDGSGTSYSDCQFMSIASDITLYAQWSNIYKVTFRHSSDAVQFDSGQTGPMECYALWIDGTEQSDLGAFSNGARTYYLPYGTPIGVVAQTKKGSNKSYVTVNGTKVAGNSSDARYQFNLTGDTDIHFEWNQWYEASITTPEISYWNCYITIN